MDKYCVKCADTIIANSNYTREFIYRAYGLCAKTNHLGVDTVEFKRLDGMGKENFVLSVGSLHHIKGHDFVIKSLARIPLKKRPRLIVIGKGSNNETKRLKNLADSCGIKLDSMHIPTTEGMVKLYNRAKLTLVASIMEPFGLVAIESMAYETPVVAVGEAGLRETVTAATGILTNRVEKEFAMAVEYLLDNTELAGRMGKQGRKHVEEKFTWQRTIEQL